MSSNIEMKIGDDHTMYELMEKLDSFGYEKVLPNHSGQFEIIGDSLKIFPVDKVTLYRIDFFGTKIEKIIAIDLTGKKLFECDEIVISENIIRLEDGAVIRPGSYIVHEDHGIGIFDRIGLRKIDQENISYFFINYLNEDKLYVPRDQINKLSSYIGVGRRKPKLSKLGSSSWKKTYQRVYDDALLMVRELLLLYANRQISKRSSYKINTAWNEDAIKTFGFSETSDQQKAISDVFSDLQKDVPMDRLICGDVGFGKTEVALRAIIQAVANGYQVTLLVPTTILAEQHFSTFSERLKNLPIRLARISRFIKSDEQAKTISDAKNGVIDLLIGTHSLLHSRVGFKNLGMLVIDEEQKFGVKDKEKIKSLKENIDVLTLTATPIPRTLFMGLSGLRDISQISSAPLDRKSIETKVEKFSKDVINDFIKREIARNGQTYYLHNRVSTIKPVADHLEKDFPALNIAIAHGQMDEKRLADTMTEFSAGKIDILVCSTIIENGLDLPNVNTMIVEEADNFGLSQLYQIRGRIGRSKRQSYALFTYKNKLSPLAFKRLKALTENTELGTGYNIALSDLEIRGGGNILGREQHGNMEAVGLVLYSKLLKAAISRIKN